MNEQGKPHIQPRLAIVDGNMLAAVGLKGILQHVMPMAEVDTFLSADEFISDEPEQYAHFFASQSEVATHLDFFTPYRHKTIVTTTSRDETTRLRGFHSFCVSVPEEMLIKEILAVEQQGHRGGRNLPPMNGDMRQKSLSNREIEVLQLIVQGCINKEIADRLNIGLTTVITHRKNIVEKLGMRSVSALTIYAVMHGYVDINCLM